MTSTAIELRHLRAVEQAQQSLQGAAVARGGVELEGKSASIKSSSECIQSSNASSLSSCFERFSSCFSRISLAGSRRQLSIRKNERKGESDEPDAPLLREGENSAWEGDVVIGREQSDQANNTANDGLQQGFAIKPQPPPGRWRSTSTSAAPPATSPAWRPTSHLAPRHKVQPISNGDGFCVQKIMLCRKWHRDLEQSSRDEGNHHHDELSLGVIW
jgi:hypothetical protein